MKEECDDTDMVMLVEMSLVDIVELVEVQKSC